MEYSITVLVEQDNEEIYMTFLADDITDLINNIVDTCCNYNILKVVECNISNE